MTSPVAGVLLAGGLAAAHFFAGKLRFLRSVPRSRTLSVAGGVSVAYVFVHLLPEITEHQAELAEHARAMNVPGLAATERALFLVALAGFAVFYGLERLAVKSHAETGTDDVEGKAETETTEPVFWIHIASFAAYNALIGYLLLHREEAGTVSLLLYFTAMALHFVVNDYGLREHHKTAYSHYGRWILSAAVFFGLFAGFLVDVPAVVLSLMLAFLAGGVVLNVIKEELPEKRESRFWAFLAGTASYTVVLLLV
ncbi:membrane protein [Halobacterium sp. DL1]|jgi:zinc transporter ZupT|nr:membrane protein [Halobacterium sp. DL1]